MLSKRNFLRIACAVLYLPIALLSMFEIINLIITNTQNKYLIVGCVVFGLLLFLIGAYFIKQYNWIQKFEKNSFLSIIIEIIIVGIAIAVLLIWQKSMYGWQTAIYACVLSAAIYMIGRFCSGRICGIVSFLSSIYLIVFLNQAQYLENQMIINMLSFLIPYLCFLSWMKLAGLAKQISVFSCVCGCLCLGIVFAFAICINPVVSVLFFGCLLNLVFVKTKNTNSSIGARGLSCAIYFLVFTVGILAALFFLNKNMFGALYLTKDTSLVLDGSRAMMDYIMLKFAKPLFYFFAPFSSGIPVLLFFSFAVLAGYYAIRNRFSFIGPIILTYVSAVCYYVFCSEHTNIFYCITCFLPILTGYGFCNVLLTEETLPIPENIEAQKTTVEENKMSENSPETEMTETKKTEHVKTEDTKLEEEKKEKENGSLKALSKEKDEIPEWTIPEELISETQPEEELELSLVTEPIEPSEENIIVKSEEDQLNDLLDRLDMTEPIKRMNESAQEDMADVIERDEEKIELSEALPLKPSKSTLPKYQKPKFDFDIQPVNIPLDDQYSNISEYDEVPTIHDLENQWKDDSKPIIETVSASEVPAHEDQSSNEISFTVPKEDVEPEKEIHTEEIIRKNGIGKRSYHKITIR